MQKVDSSFRDSGLSPSRYLIVSPKTYSLLSLRFVRLLLRPIFRVIRTVFVEPGGSSANCAISNRVSFLGGFVSSDALTSVAATRPVLVIVTNPVSVLLAQSSSDISKGSSTRDVGLKYALAVCSLILLFSRVSFKLSHENAAELILTIAAKRLSAIVPLCGRSATFIGGAAGIGARAVGAGGEFRLPPSSIATASIATGVTDCGIPASPWRCSS